MRPGLRPTLLTRALVSGPPWLHKKDPVVIWLTGGPGCSSELALFYENGPFHIADNMSLVWNDFGWDQVYLMLVC